MSSNYGNTQANALLASGIVSTIATTGNINSGADIVAAGNLYTSGGHLRTTAPIANIFNLTSTLYMGLSAGNILIGNVNGNTQIQGNLSTTNISANGLKANSYSFANGVNILSTVAGSYSNTNVAAYLTGNITTGNVNATGYYVNGVALLAGVQSQIVSTNANVTAINLAIAPTSNISAIAGNLIPSANATYNLGSTTKQWGTVYASGNIISNGNLSVFGYVLSSNAQIGTAEIGTANFNSILVYNQANVGNLTVSGFLSGTSGLETTGTYSGAYSDGVVVDYLTGNARISAGSADGINFYNNGVGNVQLASLSSSGNFKVIGNITTANIALTGNTGHPTNTSTVVQWARITVGGVAFWTPLYQ